MFLPVLYSLRVLYSFLYFVLLRFGQCFRRSFGALYFVFLPVLFSLQVLFIVFSILYFISFGRCFRCSVGALYLVFAQRVSFIPLPEGTFGGWHPVASRHISRLGRGLARSPASSSRESTTKHRFWRLAFSIREGNAALVLGQLADIVSICLVDSDFYVFSDIPILLYIRFVSLLIRLFLCQ